MPRCEPKFQSTERITNADQLEPQAHYVFNTPRRENNENTKNIAEIIRLMMISKNISQLDLCFDILLKSIARKNNLDIVSHLNQLNSTEVKYFIGTISKPAQVYFGFSIAGGETRDMENVRHHKFHCKVGITRSENNFERAEDQLFIRYAIPFQEFELNRLQVLIVENLISSVVRFQYSHVVISEVIRASRKLQSANQAVYNEQGQLANVRSDLEQIIVDIIQILGSSSTLEHLQNIQSNIAELENSDLSWGLHFCVNDLYNKIETLSGSFETQNDGSLNRQKFRDRKLLIVPNDWYKTRQIYSQIIPQKDGKDFATSELQTGNIIKYIGAVCKVAIFVSEDLCKKRFYGVLKPRIDNGDISLAKTIQSFGLTSEVA